MSLFASLFKTTVDTITSPIDLAKDIVTFGGLLTDENESYTEKKLKKIGRDLEEVGQEVDDII